MDIVVVIDFETTGLSAHRGDRATEVAAVKIVGDEVVDIYQSLINSVSHIPAHIEALTGITSAMLQHAPGPTTVMRNLRSFFGTTNLVAHNASFDKAFLKEEMHRAGITINAEFCCTKRLAKRLYPSCPDFKLETLARYADIELPARLHRAADDACLTSELWLQMRRDIAAKYRCSPPSFERLHLAQSKPSKDYASIFG